MREEDEIQEMADRAASASHKPSVAHSMTYEQGVSAALDWVLDESIPDDEGPL